MFALISRHLFLFSRHGPFTFWPFPVIVLLRSRRSPLLSRYSPLLSTRLSNQGVQGCLVNQALCRLCLYKYPKVCLHSATMGQALWNTVSLSSKMLEINKICAHFFYFWASIWAVHVLLRADDSKISRVVFIRAASYACNG